MIAVNFRLSVCALLAALVLLPVGPAMANRPTPAIPPTPPISVPAAGTLEVGFSPDGGAEQLVLRVIASARTELKVLAYSFSSPTVTAALVKAARRGVAVTVLADYKRNLVTDHSGKAREALARLVEAGIDVRMVSTFHLHHDKVLIADRETVELGSFNFVDSAAHRNSENALVNWNNPALAEAYLAHFERNLALSEPFRAKE